MSCVQACLCLLLGSLLAGCCRNHPPAEDHAVPPGNESTTDAEARAAPDSGLCFTLVKSSVEVGEAPEVVFAAALEPPPDESYWIETVPASSPEHISRRWKTLESGSTKATLDPLPYAAEWEVRLHDSSPTLAKHIICKRPLAVVEIPPEKIPVDLETLGLSDDEAAKIFIDAIPPGTADTSVAPRRWEVKGLKTVSRFVLGRYTTKAGPKMALVARGHGGEKGQRVDLPGTDSVKLLGVADLMADAEHAEIHTYPPGGGGKATVIEVPESVRFPAVLLSTRKTLPDRGSRELVIVAFEKSGPRVVLEFPLSGAGGSEGSFSTLRGPDFTQSSGKVLDVELLQHAHPTTAKGRPGPPTTFVCRWDDERYSCGRP